MSFNLYELFRSTQEKGVIFCFCGPVSQGIIEGLGETIKQKMSLEERNQTTILKVFSVFIEQMQNVVNYSADKVVEVPPEAGDIRIGILVVGNEGDLTYVRCGNVILRRDVEALSRRLERLQGLGKEELKVLYKERVRAAAEAGSKGAGLGFIDMARKASRPIEFGFQELDAERSFFSIHVVI